MRSADPNEHPVQCFGRSLYEDLPFLTASKEHCRIINLNGGECGGIQTQKANGNIEFHLGKDLNNVVYSGEEQIYVLNRTTKSQKDPLNIKHIVNFICL